MLRGKLLEEEQKKKKIEIKPPISLKELREQRRLQEEENGRKTNTK
jgi:hypothetical protein